MNKADYEQYVPEELRTKLGEPYTFLARSCLALLATWDKGPKRYEPINIVFGMGQRQHDITAQYGILEARKTIKPSFRLGGLSFGDAFDKNKPETSVLPLQAADLVVYEHVKCLKDWSSTRKGTLRRSLEHLQKIPSRGWHLMRSQDIRDSVATWTSVLSRR